MRPLCQGLQALDTWALSLRDSKCAGWLRGGEAHSCPNGALARTTYYEFLSERGETLTEGDAFHIERGVCTFARWAALGRATGAFHSDGGACEIRGGCDLGPGRLRASPEGACASCVVVARCQRGHGRATGGARVITFMGPGN